MQRTAPAVPYNGRCMADVVIHTDGACDVNPGPGGWAAVVRHGERVREISGGAPATTNNRMELQAAIEALRLLKRPCTVELYTDSQYLRNGISEWLPGWKQRGWLTAARKPVKNADLWRELDALASQHSISWRWLRGHSGHSDNERCDQLANEQVRRIKGAVPAVERARLLREFQTRGEA